MTLPVTSLDGLLRLLDTRSFASLWFWLALAVIWSLATRSVIGVPGEVVSAARRAPATETHKTGAPATETPEGLLLLDWLSLTLPRWRIGRTEGAVLAGLAAFLLVSLGVLGFGYGLEMAQALVIIGAPLTLLTVMRLHLAHRLAPLLAEATQGALPAAEAGARAARMMTRHRLAVSALSILAVAVTAAWGTLWNLMHPNGL